MDLSCFIAGARARYARSREGQPWATLYYAVALDASHFGSQPTSMRSLPEGAHLCR